MKTRAKTKHARQDFLRGKKPREARVRVGWISKSCDPPLREHGSRGNISPVIFHADWWLISFLLTAALLVGWEMRRGWRSGAMRQILKISAFCIAYSVAVWCGRVGVRLLGHSDLFTSLGVSVVVGTAVFFAISAGIRRGLRRFFPQSTGSTGVKHNALGSAIGALFGLLLVWLAAVGIRVLGTVAENVAPPPVRQSADEMTAFTNEETNVPPGGLITGISALKNSLDRGTAGAVMNRVDPVPVQTYSVLAKITRIIADPKRVERFTAYPGAQALMDHPRMIALRDDPAVQSIVLSRNYLALLTNERVTAALNDPELGELVKKFELEKALDFALQAEPPTN